MDDPYGNYYVDPTTLTGLGQILIGNPQISASQRYIMLPKVTAIFPSITLASWASIFTGKMPNETGIPGNEFFARDLINKNISVPERYNKPPGIISFGGGAFQGYDEFNVWEMRFSKDFFIPYQGNWSEPVDPLKTPQNDPDILKSKTLFESIKEIPQVQNYYSGMGGDPVVVANFHYARGAYWLTWDVEAGCTFVWTCPSETMDQASWDKFEDYLGGKYRDILGRRNDVPFSALTAWYLPGLDHEAHIRGMTGYRDYFLNNTDEFIKKMVNKLKELDEFYNKIFIIVADHGMTAMPDSSQMVLEEKDENGNVIKTWYGDASCKLKIEKFGTKKVQYPELANNNLHIWELGEVLKIVGENGLEQYKVLAPKEIGDLYKKRDRATNEIIELPYGATQKVEDADIIVGLNGPMAHIYLTDINKLGKVAELLRLTLSGYYPAEALKWWDMDDLDYLDFKENSAGRMKASVDKIFIRVSGDYCVFDGLNNDGSPRCAESDSFSSTEYVDAWTRINGMNHKDRSGDIVLIMKDATSGNAADRYTTGSACKSWHGSLNPSDSYVPFIYAYPGGNKKEVENILQKDTVCKTDYTNCKGNWKLTDIVKEIISVQYK